MWLSYWTYPYNPIFTTNTKPRGTLTRENPLKGFQNPISRNPDNLLKGIWNLVRNGIRSQWPRGSNVPTYIDINLSNQPLISTCQWHQYNYYYLFNSLFSTSVYQIEIFLAGKMILYQGQIVLLSL